MKKNNKGFTLIELLAVIVVLAIIMVIATQQVNKTMSGARANSFVESYQMIVKQANIFIANGEEPTCDGTNEDTCLKKYDLSNDYTLKVEEDTNKTNYTITLSANTTDGKFKNVDLTRYGNYYETEDSSKNCSIKKIGSKSTSCSKNSITGTIAK